MPPELDIHIIVDNYQHAQKCRRPSLAQTREAHRFHFHFTPRGSWLNHVERWFGLITDKMILRGAFHSVDELERAIYAWLASWNDKPKALVGKAAADVILDKVRRCKEAFVKN